MSTTIAWRTALALLGVAGALLVLAATAHAPGVVPNSVIYLSAAESLAEGRGLVALKRVGGFGPLTHFPPLFPAMIAAPSILGVEPLDAARWLNAFFLGGSGVMIALLARRAGGSVARAAAAGGLFLLSQEAVQHHLFVLSEPAWLFLSLVGLYFLGGFLAGGRFHELILASTALGLALLTRYAGVALAGCGMLWLLARPRAGARTRIRNAAVFAAIAGIPMALWIVRNQMVAGTAVNRQVVFHPPEGADLAVLAQTVSDWVVPLGAPVWIKAAGIGFVVVMIALTCLGCRAQTADREQAGRQGVVRALVATSIAAYLLLILLVISYVDAAVTMSRRTALPVFAMILVLVFGALDPGARGERRRAALRTAGWILVGALALFYGARYAVLAAETRSEGLWLSGARWEGSPLVEAIERLPAGTRIYSNSVEAVYYLTRREARILPFKVNKFLGRPNARYPEEMERLGEELRAGGGVVAIFRRLDQESFPGVGEIESLGLARARETEIGILLAPR